MNFPPLMRKALKEAFRSQPRRDHSLNSELGSGPAIRFLRLSGAKTFVLGVIAFGILSLDVSAQNYTGGGSWSVSANWQGGLIPNGAGATANFGPNFTGDFQVTLDGNKTVGTLSMLGYRKVAIASGTGGTLILDNGGSFATLSEGSYGDFANLSITTPVNLVSSVNVLGGNPGAYIDPLAIAVRLSGPISGSGGISLSGGGVLALTNNNSYNGATTVARGSVLSIDGYNSGSGAVNMGGQLMGSGTVSSLVSVAPHGIIRPGDWEITSTMLTLQSGLTLNSSTFAVNLDAASTASALLAVTGSVDLSGDNTLHLNLQNGVALDGVTSYTIMTFTGALTGTFDTFHLTSEYLGQDYLIGPNLPAGYAVYYQPHSIVVGPVPEPGTFALFGTGFLSLLGWRRRAR